MTVKKITDQQKDAVALIYHNKTKTVLEMAVSLGVSERTIRRILVEKGEIVRQVKPAKSQYDVMQVLKAWNIKPWDLNLLLSQLEDQDYINMVDGKPMVASPKGVNYLDVIAYMSLADKQHYEDILTSVIHTREAIRYNISVQAAMLRLERETINAGKKDKQDAPD